MEIKKANNFIKKNKNNENYNNLLRDILKDKKQQESLRLTSLLNIDDLSIDDITLLENIINTEDSTDLLKGNAIRALKRIDKEKGNKYVLEVLNNVDESSDWEIGISLDTLGEYNDKTSLITESEDEIDLISNVLKKTNKIKTIQDAVYSLGHFKNEKSVKTVLENRSKINDDYLIAYYIDQNYLVVDKMLSSKDNTDLALTCVEIAPFKSFLPKITELANASTDIQMKNRLENLINLINESIS